MAIGRPDIGSQASPHPSSWLVSGPATAVHGWSRISYTGTAEPPNAHRPSAASTIAHGFASPAWVADGQYGPETAR